MALISDQRHTFPETSVSMHGLDSKNRDSISGAWIHPFHAVESYPVEAQRDDRSLFFDRQVPRVWRHRVAILGVSGLLALVASFARARCDSFRCDSEVLAFCVNPVLIVFQADRWLKPKATDKYIVKCFPCPSNTIHRMTSLYNLSAST